MTTKNPAPKEATPKTTSAARKTSAASTRCPCGTGAEFAACCEPYIEGKTKPATAEKLMRSRYTAFATADVDYIEKTTDPSSRTSFDRDATLDWAKNSDWKGLEIVKVDEGTEKDTTGTVEFIAHYTYEEAAHDHHERAEFKKRDGQWFFLDGKLVQAPVRNPDKVGRNEPCPCGSGKKYKKCCAA